MISDRDPFGQYSNIIKKSLLSLRSNSKESLNETMYGEAFNNE